MEKILFISNIAKRVGTFSVASIGAAHECDLQFHMAANWSAASEEQIKEDQEKYNVKIHNISLARSPYSISNIKAYKQLIKIIESENIDYIHCNTPVGGILGRLAGKRCNVKKVIYQAHGFHFYKGAPLINWFLYYPVERWLAHYTDAIITINQEDFERAQKFHLRKNGKVYYVPGVGIDTSKYITDSQVRIRKRLELGIKDNEIVFISMGDLIERKNYPLAIEAISKVNDPNVHYFICGQGPDENKLKLYAKELGIEQRVHFLGYRNDIKELLTAADVFLFTTKQEGLARSLMEAMASGLPCIASCIRGNTDLLNESKGGFLCRELSEYVDAIKKLVSDKALRNEMSIKNIDAIQHFNIENATEEVKKVYLQEIGGINLLDFIPKWARKRTEIGVPLDAVLLISVGELNVNKNNKDIISALGKLQNNKIHYILCGVGEKEIELRQQAIRFGIEENVHFLGYRTDIQELLAASDIFVMSSFREGLSRSIMEAMASGLPCVVSKIRGNVDLIEDRAGGFLCDKVTEYMTTIRNLANNKMLRAETGFYNLKRIRCFDINSVIQEVKIVYLNIMEK